MVIQYQGTRLVLPKDGKWCVTQTPVYDEQGEELLYVQYKIELISK